MLVGSTAEIVSVTVVGLAGVFAGVVTAILAARERRQERSADRAHAGQQALRNEMLTTAATLAGELTSAYYRLVQLSEYRAAETLDEIHGTLDGAALHLGRASLLFGPTSPAIRAAEGAYQNVRTLLQWRRALVEGRVEPEDLVASEKFKVEDGFAGTNLKEFKRFAYEAAERVTGPVSGSVAIVGSSAIDSSTVAMLVIDKGERRVLAVFAFAAVMTGLVAAAILANSLQDRTTMPTSYWEKLLTITGVAALPIVAMAVLIVRAAFQTGTKVGIGGVITLVGGMVAFAITLVVIGICLHEIVVAADATAGTTPAAPPDWMLWVATLGTGVTLASVAAGVAALALDKIDDVS